MSDGARMLWLIGFSLLGSVGAVTLSGGVLVLAAALRARLDAVEYLIGYEGNAFASSGNPLDDLLSITAVHPMREDANLGLIRASGADPDLPDRLLAEGLLFRAEYGGHRFYLRRPRRSHHPS